MGAIHQRVIGEQLFSQSILRAKDTGQVPVIVDIKPISPRDGNLLNRRKPVDLGCLAEQAGACAVSVVTESGNFGGSIDMLRDVARACTIPVLQKDFFSTPEQVIASYEAGAGAFLIIMATTSDETARDLFKQGQELGMESIVEIHTVEELTRALKLDPTIIGINNRDIRRLEMDSGDVRATETLAPEVPEHIVTVSESALQTPEDVKRAIHAGADAVLIGTAILREADLKAALKHLTTFESR